MTPGERIAQLEEEVAYYRRELGLAKDVEREALLVRQYRIIPAEGRLLLCLYDAGRTVGKDHLTERCGQKNGGVNSSIVHTYVCRLRKTFVAGGIETVWGLGYRLSAAGRAAIDTVLQPALIAA